MSANNLTVPLPATGERFLPGMEGVIELEHLHRYLLAQRLSAGKRVLDIASGEGYGSALLAQVASQVTGVDIAPEAVAHAQKKYQKNNLTFRQGACAAIPLDDHSVDVVISFETIEHHTEHQEMMREIKRVLVPGGLLLISSPDKLEYSDRPGYANPYHVQELYRGEFTALLTQHFAHFQLSGQRVVYGSAIFAETSSRQNVANYDLQDGTLTPLTGVVRAVYLLALASDGDLPELQSGLLELPVAHADEMREAAQHQATMELALAERDNQIASYSKAIDQQSAAMAQLGAQIGIRDTKLAGMKHLIEAREQQVSDLEQRVAEKEAQVMHAATLAQQHQRQLDALASLEQRALQSEVRLAASTAQQASQERVFAETMNTYTGHINQFSTTVERLERELKAAREVIDDRDACVLQTSRMLAQILAQQVDYHTMITERDRLVEELRKQIFDSGTRIVTLEQSVHERDVAHNATLDEIWRSTSWRLTKSVRAVGTHLKRKRRAAPDLGVASASSPAAGETNSASAVEGTFADPAAAVAPMGTHELTDFTPITKSLIPQIAFDSTQNRFVAQQENPAIDPLVRVIAFYLPQFHPFAENDVWWGKGFTEWTNVGKALPNYVGHYQPHCPIHNGYYDLRVPAVMEEQARLAKQYGVHGFSYYFYWFGGKILMDTPLELMLANKKVDMPFCFTWANENWTRRWDGAEHDVLIGQNHSDADSLAFIRHLIKYFKDERYIRVDGKPVLMIYRANIIPNMAATAAIWREELQKHGIPGLYLVSAQSFGIRSPDEFDFDASVEFPPHTSISAEISSSLEVTNPDYQGNIYNYEQVVENAILSPEPDYKLFRTAMLSWDNTARKQNASHIFHNFTLLRYKQWLSSLVNKAFSNPKYAAGEKFVFINAWNEWAEGTHLEPDQKFGFGYLQTTYDVLKDYDRTALASVAAAPPVRRHAQAVILHLHYLELWTEVVAALRLAMARHGFDLYVTVTSAAAYQTVVRDWPDAHVELVENRGRDVLPFLKMLGLIHAAGYTAVCKIHSKRSVYRSDGDAIRDEIFSALLGTHEHVAKILSRFQDDPQLGMLVPEKYLIAHTGHNMTFDTQIVAHFAQRLGFRFEYGTFPAGSMFWFNPAALASLLRLDQSDFELESGLADGTSAHGVERLFCTVVEAAHYRVEVC